MFVYSFGVESLELSVKLGWLVIFDLNFRCKLIVNFFPITLLVYRKSEGKLIR